MMLAAVAVSFLLGSGPLADDQSITETQRVELAAHFGFGPFEIYKLERAIGLLTLADLDNDGRTDILLWNAYRSRLELFYQPDPDKPPPADRAELERNELPDRGSMRHERVPVAYRVASLAVADLTGDGRADIVFFGEPKELVILPGLKEGGFGPASGVRAPEGDPRSGALAVGDFNHDGRADVALCGEEVILVFHQKPAGGLAKPLRIVHNIAQPGLMLTIDLNGDGRDDLIIGSDDEEYGAQVCLQEQSGALGPMRRVKIPRLRSMTVAKAEGGDDFFAIERTTGRLKQFRWEQPSATATTDWPELRYPYPVSSKSKKRPLAVGDLTGDGLAEVVVADPDAAQLILFVQGPAGLGSGTAFPGLVKTIDLTIADVDGDGKNEVVSVSAKESLIGVSRYVDGRLTFPTPLPTKGVPLAVAVGSVKAGAKASHVAYVSREEKKIWMHLQPFDGNALSWPLESLEDDPAGLRFADVNQDGLNDLLLFVQYSAMQTFLQQPDGTFERLSGAEARTGLVKEASLTGFALADVTGDGKPEMLLAQKNLARALVVRDGKWTVVDQYNPESADAKITGLAVLPAGADGPTVALYDRSAQELLALRRRADTSYAVARTMPIGNYDLTAMTAAPIGGGGALALLLADARMLVVYQLVERGATLVEKHSYETERKDAWLSDSVIGDLNHDGVRDVAAIDGGKANVEILTTLPNGDLVRATRFQVFQGKRFTNDPSGWGEPREVLIGEVTGDTIDDIVLIVHDRLIVYPGQ